MQGWLIKPANFEAGKKYPMVLWIHGGPWSMYNVAFNWAFQNFAANGYAVLYTNPRGSTGYGQDFVNGIQYSYPGKDYDDLMAGVDAALAKGFIDEREPVRLRRQRRRRADRLDRRSHQPLRGGRVDAARHQLALVRRHHRRRVAGTASSRSIRGKTRWSTRCARRSTTSRT